MKITLKKTKVTQIINEEIEKILLEQKKFKTAGLYAVGPRANGKTYPGMQRLFDRRTEQIMDALDELKEAESGTWYQTKSADAEDYEEAYQKFLLVKGHLETLQRIIKKRQRTQRKSNPEFAKWDFGKNYGSALPEVKEKYPNFVTKITVEKSSMIRGGVNPTVHFSNGKKKTFQTPKRKLTSANATQAAWKKSVLVFDGEQLSWRVGGLQGEPFDSSDPIGGPWNAGSGDISDGTKRILFGIDFGSLEDFKDARRPEVQKLRRATNALRAAGPIPEGWYKVGAGRGMEVVPKSLVGNPDLLDYFSYYFLIDKSKLKMKFDQARQNKDMLKYERIWRNAAWGTQRMYISNRGKHPNGKRIINMSQIYGRGAFYIHGGTFRSSSGCIDLGGDMPEFHEFWVKKWLTTGLNSGEVSLYVNYRDKDDNKKLSQLIQTPGFVGKETGTKWDEKEKQNSQSGWDIPDTHLKKITGCYGGGPISSKIRLRDKDFYNLMKKVVPEEILSRKELSGWDIGRPGKKSRLIVAMLQMNIFNGDLNQVDGCLGKGTLAALKKR